MRFPEFCFWQWEISTKIPFSCKQLENGTKYTNHCFSDIGWQSVKTVILEKIKQMKWSPWSTLHSAWKFSLEAHHLAELNRKQHSVRPRRLQKEVQRTTKIDRRSSRLYWWTQRGISLGRTCTQRGGWLLEFINDSFEFWAARMERFYWVSGTFSEDNRRIIIQKNVYYLKRSARLINPKKAA